MMQIQTAFSLFSASALMVLVSSSASAAPWPINVQVPLPNAPAQVTRYIVQNEPVLTVQELAPVFALAGSSEFVTDDADPYEHHADGPDHAYVYVQGGAVFHATQVLGSETPITKRSNSQVFSSASSLLTSLGINGYGPFTLVQGNVGRAEVTIHKADGTTVGPSVTHQQASYLVKLNGQTTFGGGSEISVMFGQNAKVAAFSHALRNLQNGGLHACKPASEALDDFSERADLFNRFTVLRTGLSSVNHVDITGITLGYYMPDLATLADTIEPVYEIKGVMVGQDPAGNAATAELLWYEPALRDAALPDLGIWGDPQLNIQNAPLPGSIEKPL